MNLAIEVPQDVVDFVKKDCALNHQKEIIWVHEPSWQNSMYQCMNMGLVQEHSDDQEGSAIYTFMIIGNLIRNFGV